MRWEVEVLNSTVADEIRALSADFRAHLSHITHLIRIGGVQNLRAPHVKHLQGKIWEIRLTGRDGIARVLYVTALGKRVILVRAFVKKTQKTPQAEIEMALRRAEEVK